MAKRVEYVITDGTNYLCSSGGWTRVKLFARRFSTKTEAVKVRKCWVEWMGTSIYVEHVS